MKRLFFSACLLLLIAGIGSCQRSKNKELTVGDSIPAFHLPDQNGQVFNSSDHLGKTCLVIFFYPKDESMVCTKEACSFRDRYADIVKAGAIVIGINGALSAATNNSSNTRTCHTPSLVIPPTLS